VLGIFRVNLKKLSHALCSIQNVLIKTI